MTESERTTVENVRKYAKKLQKEVHKLCNRGACNWCPLDTIGDCNNYNQLARMKYKKDMDIFINSEN